MLSSNTNKLVWVGIAVGVIAGIGASTMVLFPSAMDTAGGSVTKTVMSFVIPDEGFGVTNPNKDDYHYNDDGTADLTNYHQTAKDVVIPSELRYGGKTYKVTTVNDGALQGKGITSVQMSSTITSIGTSAFENNNLTSVSIPDSVVNIGSNAFANNKLTSVNFGSNVKSIGRLAFMNNQLASVSFDSKLETIGSSAFQGNAFESVAFPDSVTKIGDWAFTRSDTGKYVKTISKAPAIIAPGGANYNANAFDAGVSWPMR